MPDERVTVNKLLLISSTQAVEELFADPPTAYLDPDVLSDEAKRAEEAFHVEGSSENTRRTYHTALLSWGRGMRCAMGGR